MLAAESRVRDFLKSKVKQNFFSGASVVFGKNGQKLLSVHEGTLSTKTGVPVNASTTFDLQSMTKALVTAPLFLMLQRQGKLDLDAAIDQYLPSFAPRLSREAQITFRQLLTHSAGFSDADLEGDFGTAFDFWNRIFTAPLHAEPGARIEYSDLGYRILGKIIESVLGESLESAARRHLFSEVARELTYSPLDPFNVAGCPNAHGTIDDEQVRLLGGIVGCDGLFGSAEGVFNLVCGLMKADSALGMNLGHVLRMNTHLSEAEIGSYFDALAVGSKTIGWEVNPNNFSYAGRFLTPDTFEKAGGAGTFVWFDESTGYVFVYLTNYGKPKPFDDRSWNQLLADLQPCLLSDLVYETF